MQVPDNHLEDPTKEPVEEEVNPPHECTQYNVSLGCPDSKKHKEEKERRQEEAKKEGRDISLNRLSIHLTYFTQVEPPPDSTAIDIEESNE